MHCGGATEQHISPCCLLLHVAQQLTVLLFIRPIGLGSDYPPKLPASMTAYGPFMA